MTARRRTSRRKTRAHSRGSECRRASECRVYEYCVHPQKLCRRVVHKLGCATGCAAGVEWDCTNTNTNTIFIIVKSRRAKPTSEGHRRRSLGTMVGQKGHRSALEEAGSRPYQ